MQDYVVVSYAGERARCYREGGIGYDRWESGIGWVLNDEPSATIEELARAARHAFFLLETTANHA